MIRRFSISAIVIISVFISTTCTTTGLPIFNQSNSSGGGTWDSFAALAEARQEIGVAELDGKIYVVGGILSTQGTANTVEVFDPETDTWSFLAPLPARLHHIALVSFNGKLYSIGGYTGGFVPVNSVFEYDPDANTWTTKTPLPRALGSPAAALIDNKIYVVGGVANNGVRNSFFSYEPATDSWSALPAMPTPRDHLAAAVVDGKFYAAGGRNPSDFTLSVIEVYDPATSTWSRLADMPTGRSGIAAGVLGGCIYVFGGEGNSRNVNRFGVFPENEMYNPKTDAWQTMTPMALARHGIGAAVVEEKIHIPGGAPVEGFGVTAIHDAYVPPSDVGCE